MNPKSISPLPNSPVAPWGDVKWGRTSHRCGIPLVERGKGDRGWERPHVMSSGYGDCQYNCRDGLVIQTSKKGTGVLSTWNLPCCEGGGSRVVRVAVAGVQGSGHHVHTSCGV